MATSAFIVYTDTAGELRGTLVARMGGNVPQMLSERFGKDRAAIIDFIETGRARGGYRTAEDVEPYWEADDEQAPVSLAYGEDADYVWHVLPSGELEPVRLVPTYRIVHD